jgi:hypothetical protein
VLVAPSGKARPPSNKSNPTNANTIAVVPIYSTLAIWELKG